MAKKATEAHAAASPADPLAAPGKWVYAGDKAPYGPHRGFTPDSIAECLGLVDEARQDFVDNLHPW